MNDVAKCYAGWAATYYRDYYGPQAKYPPVHVDLVRHILDRHKPASLLDVGCGPASMLRHLATPGRWLYGFDISPEMIEAAKKVLVNGATLWVGDALNKDHYLDKYCIAPAIQDAVTCVGVLPHVAEEQDETLIGNIHHALRPGGVAIVEARNELFSLFALNRHSREFFVDKLVPKAVWHAGEVTIYKDMMEAFDCTQPPESEYDKVARMHNPLTLPKLFEANGFRDVKVHFYHYHCLPPMFGERVPELYRRISLEMEKPDDWRGHFMASAFIVEAVKI